MIFIHGKTISDEGKMISRRKAISLQMLSVFLQTLHLTDSDSPSSGITVLEERWGEGKRGDDERPL